MKFLVQQRRHLKVFELIELSPSSWLSCDFDVRMLDPLCSSKVPATISFSNPFPNTTVFASEINKQNFNHILKNFPQAPTSALFWSQILQNLLQ